jgi:hypothetical protein
VPERQTGPGSKSGDEAGRSVPRILLPGQRPSTEIPLTTRAGSSIRNEQCYELTAGQLLEAADFPSRYGHIGCDIHTRARRGG